MSEIIGDINIKGKIIVKELISLPLPPNCVYVLRMKGQSNLLGQGLVSAATTAEKAIQSNCVIWVADAVNDWQFLQAGVNNNSTNSSTLGIEVPLAVMFAEQFPNEILYIIKEGEGGTNIDDNSPGGTLYERFKSDYSDPALNNLLAQGKIPYVFDYYSQGESDAIPSRYQDFSEKFQLLRSSKNKRIGSGVPLIIPEIIQPGTLANSADINNVFKAASVIYKDVHVLNSSEYSSGDNLHFDYAGLKQIASDVLNYMVSNPGGIVNKQQPYFYDNTKYLEGTFDFSNANVENFPNTNTPNQLTFNGDWDPVTNTPTLANGNLEDSGKQYRSTGVGSVSFGASLGTDLTPTGAIDNSGGATLTLTGSGFNITSDGTGINLRPRIAWSALEIGATYRVIIVPDANSGDTQISFFDGASYIFNASIIENKDFSFTANGTNVFFVTDGTDTFNIDFAFTLQKEMPDTPIAVGTNDIMENYIGTWFKKFNNNQ